MLSTRRSAAAGVLAVACSLVAIVLAPAIPPWFSWTTNALSDLGTADGPERLLFDYGLVAAGVVGAGFIPAVARSASNRVGRASTVPVAAALAGVVGVGLFPTGTPLHFPAALTAYLGFLLSPAVWGVGELLAGNRRAGLLSVLDALVHFLVWFPASFVFLGVAFGLAVPELLGALLFDAWVLGVAARVRW